MLTLKETQNVETEILQKFHDFCKENGLRYCMVYGTLLGAVRHQGFIPWDNDIDVCMPREDYDKLIEMSKLKPIGENLKVLHYSFDNKYHYMVTRICDSRTTVIPGYLREVPDNLGLWIDIFAVDGIWDRPLAHPFYWIGLTFNKYLQRAETYYLPGRKSISNKIKHMAMIMFPSKNNNHQANAEKIARKCSFEKYGKGVDITDWDRRNYRYYFTAEDFNEPTEMSFEGHIFWGPKSWENHLKATYGDYMQLPPVEKRVTHDIKAEWVPAVSLEKE